MDVRDTESNIHYSLDSYLANFRLGSSSRSRCRRGADPLCVTEIAGLCLHKISYKKKIRGGFDSLLFHLEDYYV